MKHIRLAPNKFILNLKNEKEMKQTQENISISKGKPFIIEKITSKALPDADICHEEFEQINY